MFPLLVFLVALPACPQSQPPVAGPVIERFAPIGRYGGHWGLDYAVEPGTDVRSVAPGRVTFAGSVAGTRSVSIDHGRGWKTTLSYLSEMAVRRGDRKERGTSIGKSGVAHGTNAVHLSLRIDGAYVDPQLIFDCRIGDIADALWLREPGANEPTALDEAQTRETYSVGGATRAARRNLRSSPYRPPGGGGGRLSPIERRHGDLSPGRRSLAKG